jgi:hypothetical protein
MSEIETGDLLNLILVRENIRPAFLFQPIDYNESSKDGEKCKQILNNIQELFPELNHYEITQGILISKQNLNIEELLLISGDKLGKILGYPCWDGFSKIDSDTETTYGIDIIVVQNNNHIQLIANICKDYSNYLIEFKDFIDKCKSVFFKDSYNYLHISDVIIDIQKYPSLDSIIDKLVYNHPLDNSDKNKISNIFYNASFYYLNSHHFEEDNPKHQGILLGILLNEKNSLLTPFIPIKPDSLEYTKICEISKKMENDIILLLNQTCKQSI